MSWATVHSVPASDRGTIPVDGAIHHVPAMDEQLVRARGFRSSAKPWDAKGLDFRRAARRLVPGFVHAARICVPDGEFRHIAASIRLILRL